MLLSREAGERFQACYGDFLRYVNQHSETVNVAECTGDLKDWSTEVKQALRAAWMANPDWLETYLVDTGNQWSATEQAAVRSWKNFKFGNFVVFQQQKKHAILLSDEQPPSAYGVWAHRMALESVANAKPPFLITTLLLPWEGVITYDGTLVCPDGSFGAGAEVTLNQSFREAKAARGIITELVDEAERAIPEQSNAPSEDVLYQIKISLRGTKPPVWRTIQTRDCSMAQLHDCIQVVMGWQDRQPHLFSIHGQRYRTRNLLMDTGAGNDLDASLFRLSDFATEEKVKFGYVYDFRRNWEHQLVVEKILTAKPGKTYPICLKGKLASPPETIQGVGEFYDYVEAISDPEHYQYHEMLQQHGAFDRNAFDAGALTERLQAAISEFREEAE